LEVPVLSKILTRSLLGGSEYDAPEWIDLGDGMRGVVPENDGGMLPEVVVEDERPGNNQGGLDIDINDGELIPPPNNDNPGSGGNNNDEDDRNGDNPNDPNEQDSPNEQSNDANEGQYDPNDEHEGRGGAGTPSEYTIQNLPQMHEQVPSACVFTSMAFVDSYLTKEDVDPGKYILAYMIWANAPANFLIDPNSNFMKNGLDIQAFTQSQFETIDLTNGYTIEKALTDDHLCLATIPSDASGIFHEVVIVGYHDYDGNGKADVYSFVDPLTAEKSSGSINFFSQIIVIEKHK
jgi:hypothetical protein